jgi:hypothetical protein
MRVAVVVTRSGISRRIAVLVDVPSIMVIAAVAACDCYGGHHHKNAGGEFVRHHLLVPWGIFSWGNTRPQYER